MPNAIYKWHRFLFITRMKADKQKEKEPKSVQDAQAPQDENPAAGEQNPGGPPPKRPLYTAPGKSAKNTKPVTRAKK
jgi:hypothetical protein